MLQFSAKAEFPVKTTVSAINCVQLVLVLEPPLKVTAPVGM